MSTLRFVTNTLHATPLDEHTLLTTLAQLQSAIASTVGRILHECFPRAMKLGEMTASGDKETVYTGLPGIALMLIRLAHQYTAAGLHESEDVRKLFKNLSTLTSSSTTSLESASDVTSQSQSCIHKTLAPFIAQLLPSPHHAARHSIIGSRLSPLASPDGPAWVYVIAALTLASSEAEAPQSQSYEMGACYGESRRHGATPPPAASVSSTRTHAGAGSGTQVAGSGRGWNAAVETLRDAALVAADRWNDVSGSRRGEKGALGGGGANEVLYGRAGLLWALLSLREWAESNMTSEDQKRDLECVFGQEGGVIVEILNRLIEDGIADARYYQRVTGKEAPVPLMWAWHGKYYLGAIHGIAGILTIILQAPRALVEPYLQLVLDCTDALCALVQSPANDGHLPSSLPQKHRPHGQQPVQLCHGSPGLILLLATVRAMYPERWKEQWDKAAEKAAEVIWREGLVRKGLGVCHGVAGNAWVMVMLSRAAARTDIGDLCLSRALAFLLHARCLPPLGNGAAEPGTSTSGGGGLGAYRTPDHPYSLFEGAAGTVCAWLDACVVLRERLGRSQSPGVLGMVGLGGAGRYVV